jgi:hypothetical protein
MCCNITLYSYVVETFCSGLLILGVLALVLAIVGFFHSFCGRCCLSVFLGAAIITSLGELALIITLFVNLDSSVDNLVEYKTKNAEERPNRSKIQSWEDDFKTSLEIGRYVFLVLVLLEILGLLVTMVIRIKYPHRTEDGGTFEEQRAARSAMAQIQMESLKSTVTRSPGTAESNNFYTASSKVYKSVTKKMSEKYGAFTQDPAFQRKWWNKIPGLR